MKRLPTTFLFRKALFAIGGAVLISFQANGQLLPNLGGQRVGISAFTFLKNDISPRSMGMGGASVATTGDAWCATVNPAQASEVRNLAFGVSHLRYAGTLSHSNINAYAPLGAAGTIYATYHMLNLANQDVRSEFHPYGTGETYAAYSLAASVGYGRKLSDFFSVGVELKYLHERLARYRAGAVAADIGFLYRTDWRNLRFAAALQNFGANSTLQGDYQNDPFGTGASTATEGYPAPTVFKMGAQLDAWRSGEHVLTASAQLNHPNDNAENIRIGAEYSYGGLLFLRAGLKLNVMNERAPSAGIAFKHNFGNTELNLAYATFPSRYLGWYHQLGLAVYLPGKRADQAPTPETTP